MAKFEGYLGEMRGSVAACTWSSNKGGSYVRKRSTPTNPNSTKQTFARAVLGTLSSAWSLLTSTQRQQWTDWASLNPVVDSLGNTIIRSGQQAYVGLNARLLGAGAVSVATPPAATGPADLVTVTATATAATGAIVLTYTGTPLGAGLRLLLWQTLPQGVGRNPNKKSARLVGYSTAAAASPLTFTSPYPALVGNSANLWVQVMDAAGQVSAGKRVSVVYV